MIMRITSKGQITIPLAMRKRYGLRPQTVVEFAAADDGVLIRAARNHRQRFRAWVERARGSATTNLTTDQIMRLTRRDK